MSLPWRRASTSFVRAVRRTTAGIALCAPVSQLLVSLLPTAGDPRQWPFRQRIRFAMWFTGRLFRRVAAGGPPGKMVQIGDALVWDHPSADFAAHLNALGLLQEPSVEIGHSRRRQIAALRTALVVAAVFVPHILRARSCSTAWQADALVKSASTLVLMQGVLRAVQPTALLVTHDLIPKPRIAAIAASRHGVPVWLLQHNFRPQVTTALPVRPEGVFAHREHDACHWDPMPETLAEYPRRRRSPRVLRNSPMSRRTVGVVTHSKCPHDEELFDFLRALDRHVGVGAVRLRIHPSDRRDWQSIADRYDKVVLEHPTSPLSEFADDVDHAVVTIPWTSAVRTLLDNEVPTHFLQFSAYRDLDFNPEQLPSVSHERISEMLAGSQELQTHDSSEECVATNHPEKVDFMDTLRSLRII